MSGPTAPYERPGYWPGDVRHTYMHDHIGDDGDECIAACWRPMTEAEFDAWDAEGTDAGLPSWRDLDAGVDWDATRAEALGIVQGLLDEGLLGVDDLPERTVRALRPTSWLDDELWLPHLAAMGQSVQRVQPCPTFSREA